MILVSKKTYCIVAVAFLFTVASLSIFVWDRHMEVSLLRESLLENERRIVELMSKPEVKDYVYVNQQAIHTPQLVSQIKIVIKDLGLYSEDAVYLLLFTAACESDMGRYLKQQNGPAQGMFQMEPATEADLWKHYIPSLPKALQEKLLGMRTKSAISDLSSNLAYQISIARVHYLRVKESLPDRKNFDKVYAYYKKYWNTPKGKATEKKARIKVDKYLLNVK